MNKKLIKLAAASLLTLTVGTTVLTGCSNTSNKPGSKTEQTKGHKTVNKYIAKDGAIMINQKGAVKASDQDAEAKGKAVVSIYLDPRCPGCADLENKAGGYINDQVMKGNIVVKYYPLMFLDSVINKSEAYSIRTSGYIYGLAETRPDLVSKFMSAIYKPDFQPAEDESIHTPNSKIERLLKDIGAKSSDITKIRSNLDNNKETSFKTTRNLIVNQEMKAKAPGGELSTPIVIANKANEKEIKMVDFTKSSDVFTPTKAAIESAIAASKK